MSTYSTVLAVYAVQTHSYVWNRFCITNQVSNSITNTHIHYKVSKYLPTVHFLSYLTLISLSVNFVVLKRTVLFLFFSHILVLIIRIVEIEMEYAYGYAFFSVFFGKSTA